MPSEFICSQAELLARTKDTFAVLQNIRDKYAISSFPSQMSRVKEEWYNYEDRHEDFDKIYNHGLRLLSENQVSKRFIKQYIAFKEDDMKEQIVKSRLASKGELTGSRRTDAAIARIRILPEYMEDYKLTKDDMKQSKTISSESLDKRAMNCIVVSDGEELIVRCKHILRELNEDVFIVTSSLAVLCGRRSIEILKTGVFDESSRGEYACHFSGVAKKREMNTECCHIPLLVKFKYIKRALAFIRSKVDVTDLTNSQVNAKYSHKLGDAAKILLDSLDTRFHDLRAVYGTLTHSMFENNCSINIWLKRVLPHDNIDTSVFYSRCKVDKCGEILGEWDVDQS